MTKSLDIPQDHFHCPELSSNEQRHLIRLANDSATALIESSRSGGDTAIHWTEAGTHRGVRMFKGGPRIDNNNSALPTAAAPMASGQANYVCGAATIHATIEEVAALFDVSTTAKAKAFAATQDDMLDRAVLYTLVKPNVETQFLHQITINWFAMSMPSPWIQNRDFVTLECQRTFTDPRTGRRGWVRAYQSIQLAVGNKTKSFVRGRLSQTGHVFVESTTRGVLDCVFSCQVNSKGNLRLPMSLYVLAMKRRVGAVAQLSDLLQQRRLGAQSFLSDRELVPKHQRYRCQVCETRFVPWLVRKTCCRKCGEVVCSECTQRWTVRTSCAVRKVRVCLLCCKTTSVRSSSGRGNEAPMDATALPPNTTTTPFRRRESSFSFGDTGSRRVHHLAQFEQEESLENGQLLSSQSTDHNHSDQCTQPRTQLVAIFQTPEIQKLSRQQQDPRTATTALSLPASHISYETASSTSYYSSGDDDGDDDDLASAHQRAAPPGSYYRHHHHPTSYSRSIPMKTRAGNRGCYYYDSAGAGTDGQAYTNHGLSFSSDKANSDDMDPPVSCTIADDFSLQLLQPESSRETVESYCFSVASTGSDQLTASDHRETVELIEIQELPNEPARDTTEIATVERYAVERQLRELYQQLSDATDHQPKY